jgi:L-malate glycosyltransferase
MKIGIYSESTVATGGLGGSELIVMTLASELRALNHHVEVIHHNPGLTPALVSDRFGVDPESLNLRFAAVQPRPDSTNPWRRHLEEERWYRDLSSSYDLFINVAHQKPPFCRARFGVLYVLFPFFDASSLWSPNHEPAPDRPLPVRLYRRWYHRWNWHRVMRSYHLRAAISDFTGHWTAKRWGIATETIYPPATAGVVGAAPKQDVIVSVGRFAGAGVSKKQIEMMEAFNEVASIDSTWRYRCLGGLSNSVEDRQYVHAVRAAALSARASVETNLARSSVDEAYASAKIFWHATGAGEDESQTPELSEHFGIATVEAMQAGCVPVVPRRGAQPEIVENGVSGFLWEDVRELRDITLRLMRDDALRLQMSEAARARAKKFTREAFVQRFVAFLQPVLKSSRSHGVGE